MVISYNSFGKKNIVFGVDPVGIDVIAGVKLSCVQDISHELVDRFEPNLHGNIILLSRFGDLALIFKVAVELNKSNTIFIYCKNGIDLF